MREKNIILPSIATSLPLWWDNSSTRAVIWKDIGWQVAKVSVNKVNDVSYKIEKITFIKSDVKRELEIEEIEEAKEKRPELEEIELEAQQITEIKKKKIGSVLSERFFGIVSIAIGILAFISPANIFTYIAVINICLVGILIGTFGTKYDEKSTMAYIGVIVCLAVLFYWIINIWIFFIELAEALAGD
ncbi:MAG: hypothetical protein ACFE8A_02445 [Candidatus Hodarchaeota archaeon]